MMAAIAPPPDLLPFSPADASAAGASVFGVTRKMALMLEEVFPVRVVWGVAVGGGVGGVLMRGEDASVDVGSGVGGEGVVAGTTANVEATVGVVDVVDVVDVVVVVVVVVDVVVINLQMFLILA
jgi:hypothetical protein